MTDEWCTQSFRVLQTHILQFMTSVISAASCVIYMYIRQTARDVHLISNNYVGFYLQQSGKISYACDRARKISCQCLYSSAHYKIWAKFNVKHILQNFDVSGFALAF